MEQANKFSLVKSIGKWKNQLISTPNMTAEDIEELEAHLLDQIDELHQNGLTEEEAFLIAQKRMGKTEILKEEYAKVNLKSVFLSQLSPYLKGIFSYILFMTVVSAFYRILIWNLFLYEYQETQITYFTVGYFALVLVIIGGIFYRIYKTSRWTIFTKLLPLMIILLILSWGLNFISYKQGHVINDNVELLELYSVVFYNYFNLAIKVIVLFSLGLTYFSIRKQNKLKMKLVN